MGAARSIRGIPERDREGGLLSPRESRSKYNAQNNAQSNTGANSVPIAVVNSRPNPQKLSTSMPEEERGRNREEAPPENATGLDALRAAVAGIGDLNVALPSPNRTESKHRNKRTDRSKSRGRSRKLEMKISGSSSRDSQDQDEVHSLRRMLRFSDENPQETDSETRLFETAQSAPSGRNSRRSKSRRRSQINHSSQIKQPEDTPTTTPTLPVIQAQEPAAPTPSEPVQTTALRLNQIARAESTPARSPRRQLTKALSTPRSQPKVKKPPQVFKKPTEQEIALFEDVFQAYYKGKIIFDLEEDFGDEFLTPPGTSEEEDISTEENTNNHNKIVKQAVEFDYSFDEGL